MSLDEAMVKFEGYHPDRFYIPAKPTKYGFKIYVLTEAKSGYVLQYRITCRNE